MKNYNLFLCLLFFVLLTSCKKRKYTEFVEVPLPTTEQKISMGSPDDVVANEGAFSMIKLPYQYNELEPNIDVLTLEMHYSKHYLTYTNNLNSVLKGTEIENLSIEEIFKTLDISNIDLKNNLGGYYNHSLYWEIMSPKAGGKPQDTLLTAIDRDFGSYENFKSLFLENANKQFGSGWAWLLVDKSGKLQVTTTPNQDNPLMRNATISGIPIIALDLWEHAYYLDYQYKRKNYIDNFFNLINWKKVNQKYEEAINKNKI